MKRIWKWLLALVVIILVIIAAVAGTIAEKVKNNTVTDSNYVNILFMGIDKNEPLNEKSNVDHGYGQADALYLISLDKTSKKVRIIAIPRDTVALVHTFDDQCREDGIMMAQISLQYAYCDGTEVSCKETCDRVSETLFDVQIDGYISMTRKCIVGINDSIGGVEVTMDSDYTDINPVYVEGYTTTLTGQEAFDFINNRDIHTPQSAYERTLRQELYLNSFVPKAKKTFSRNPLKAVRLLKKYDDRMMTSFSNTDILTLMSWMKDYDFSTDNMVTLPGQIMVIGEHEEYFLDEDGVKEIIQEMF